jgi:N-acyl-D-aspartate/D-glutamate deacylase
MITLGAIREREVQQLLVQPWNMIASDGEYADSASRGPGHPRSTGTFPRVLGRYVRELKLLPLEEAVRKMTSFPADFVGLRDRGRIAEGQAADLVLFDPATVADGSTWDDPWKAPVGIPHVIVNGVPVLRHGALTGARPGSYLRARH